MDELYKSAFQLHLPGCPISVTIIHNGTDLCFNHSDREILSAIELCFVMDDIHCEFKENMLGKAVNVYMHELPVVPPFSPLKENFIKYFFGRLDLIEASFDRKQIDYTDLKKERQSLIITDYASGKDLRKKYEDRRTCFREAKTS